MNMLMIAEQPNPGPELNDDLREFADILRMVRYQPTLEEAIAAVKPHFPEATSQAQTVEQVLDPMGLVVIVEIGQGIDPKRISWSIADSDTTAQEQFKQYQSSEYSAVRAALGIDYHWIFLVPHQELTTFSDDFLVDGLIDFDNAGKPACWILDRFR